MSEELDPKIIPYGQKIGAEKALIKNGKLQCYYKKGDKASKWCWYVYTNNEYGRPLKWVSSNETCVYRIADFYRNLHHKIELIEIPKLEEANNEED